jgi:hypothetical protein
VPAQAGRCETRFVLEALNVPAEVLGARLHGTRDDDDKVQHDVLGTVALGTGLIVGSCALLATLALILPALLS